MGKLRTREERITRDATIPAVISTGEILALGNFNRRTPAQVINGAGALQNSYRIGISILREFPVSSKRSGLKTAIRLLADLLGERSEAVIGENRWK